VMGRLWPWVVLAVGWGVVTKWVQPGVGIDAGRWWERPWVAADAIGFYLWKIVWPVRLGIDYGRTPHWVIAGREVWGAATAILIAIGLCIARRVKLTAAALVFVLALLPVLGLMPFDFQSQSTVADRYVYVAMLGPAIALALAARAVPQWMSLGGSIAVIGVWSILSFHQVGVWRDSETLYRHALEVNSQSITATQDLAVVYDKSGQELQAIDCYLRAIEIAPNAPEEYDNLAMALPRAERQWPGFADRWADLHDRLAAFYEKQGNVESARQQREEAERLR
jgi:protein O-mannosyl-transferase